MKEHSENILKVQFRAQILAVQLIMWIAVRQCISRDLLEQILADPRNAIYYSNRAIANIKIERCNSFWWGIVLTGGGRMPNVIAQRR